VKASLTNAGYSVRQLPVIVTEAVQRAQQPLGHVGPGRPTGLAGHERQPVDKSEPPPCAPVLIGQDPPCARQEPRQRIRRDLVDSPAGHDEHLADRVVGTRRVDPPQRIGPDGGSVLVEQRLKPLATLDLSHACPMSTTDARITTSSE